MFYSEFEISEDVSIKVPFYGDEVFTNCSVCFERIHFSLVLLAELEKEGDDLGSTTFRCSKCRDK